MEDGWLLLSFGDVDWRSSYCLLCVLGLQERMVEKDVARMFLFPFSVLSNDDDLASRSSRAGSVSECGPCRG